MDEETKRIKAANTKKKKRKKKNTSQIYFWLPAFQINPIFTGIVPVPLIPDLKGTHYQKTCLWFLETLVVVLVVLKKKKKNYAV